MHGFSAVNYRVSSDLCSILDISSQHNLLLKKLKVTQLVKAVPNYAYYRTRSCISVHKSVQLESRFLVLGILHGVKSKFPDDVSGAAVGPIFNGHTLERK
jgi:ABC-type enterochelin transport system ATPase subunit